MKPIPGIYTKPYLDSAVFIGWIGGEVVDGVDRADIAEHILNLAELGHYKVYISSFTLAEVRKSKGNNPLNPKQNQSILDYFEHEFIEMVIVDREIGIEANRIGAAYGLDPADAVHAACAIRAGCDVILTWDKPFLNKQVPGISIEQPEKRGQGLLDLESTGPVQTMADPAPTGAEVEPDGLGDQNAEAESTARDTEGTKPDTEEINRQTDPVPDGVRASGKEPAENAPTPERESSNGAPQTKPSQ